MAAAADGADASTPLPGAAIAPAGPHAAGKNLVRSSSDCTVLPLRRSSAAAIARAWSRSRGLLAIAGGADRGEQAARIRLGEADGVVADRISSRTYTRGLEYRLCDRISTIPRRSTWKF